MNGDKPLAQAVKKKFKNSGHLLDIMTPESASQRDSLGCG
jgi:hypothetical protein